jgi:hypothetical protein
MGYHHEPFSDEAQSYLIARDVPLFDIIKDVARTEGHPLLWYLWLKVLIFCGLTYKYICFSSIIPYFFGVSLFVYKAPFSKIIKYLFPLTYFIFFQYNIVARSYSLILLFIVLSAIYYPKRQDHPYLYPVVLMLLGQITVYTLILATGIFFMGLWEDWQKKEIKYSSLVVYTIYLLLVAAMLFPTKDNQYFLSLSPSLPLTGVKTIRTISSGFITYDGYDLDNAVMLYIGTIYFIYLVMSLLQLYRKETIFLLIPALVFLCYANKMWHSGIVILTIMCIFWLKNKKITLDLKILLTLFFIVQLGWSAQALITDKNNNYSAGKDAYQFLSSQNIANEQVLKLTFNATAVCPYFNSKDCPYWDWRQYGFERRENPNNISRYKAFIINQTQYEAEPSAYNKIQQDFGYKLKIFKTNHFVASYDNSSDETLYVYYLN